jgi:uncharacterized protein (DUF1697 family)
MPRYVSFLRGINLGGRRVTMDRLRELFEALKFSNVSTFIASGNVIFDTPTTDAAALEVRIERHLERALGYEVGTFLRSIPELAAVAAHRPFTDSELEVAAHSLHVTFLKAPPGRKAEQELLALQTDTDLFRVHEREVYWLCRGSVARPSFSPSKFDRALGTPGTARNVTTVCKLAAKYADGTSR